MSDIISYLSNFLKSHDKDIIDWFENKLKESDPVIYSSVDIRHSGKKIAPVDTNLFPAGFNNLNVLNAEKASEEIKAHINKFYPYVRNIVIVPENHTRNLYYLESVYSLLSIFNKAGFDTRLGSVNLKSILDLETINKNKVTIFPLIKIKDNLVLDDGSTPDLIVINNDLSDGIPDDLQNIKQRIIPHLSSGWHYRRKSKHFEIYNELVNELSNLFALEKFFITTQFKRCGTVNFKEKTNIDCIANNVEKMIYNLKNQYLDFNIKDEPYVFIKSDRGTYGMGIMTARNGDDVMQMNKKLRNKMHSLKSGIENTEVIIQEGIKTIDKYNGHNAEPMMYLISNKPVGLMYRVHNEKDEFCSLNSQGMNFLNYSCGNYSGEKICNLEKFGVCSFIAQLASLAASMETSYE